MNNRKNVSKSHENLDLILCNMSKNNQVLLKDFMDHLDLHLVHIKELSLSLSTRQLSLEEPIQCYQI